MVTNSLISFWKEIQPVGARSKIAVTLLALFTILHVQSAESCKRWKHVISANSGSVHGLDPAQSDYAKNGDPARGIFAEFDFREVKWRLALGPHLPLRVRSTKELCSGRIQRPN